MHVPSDNIVLIELHIFYFINKTIKLCKQVQFCGSVCEFWNVIIIVFKPQNQSILTPVEVGVHTIQDN